MIVKSYKLIFHIESSYKYNMFYKDVKIIFLIELSKIFFFVFLIKIIIYNFSKIK